MRSARRTHNCKAEMVSFYTFAEEITVDKALTLGDMRKRRELEERSHINRECENGCGNPVWRYGVGELCFPCCTGETDASEDFELAWVP